MRACVRAFVRSCVRACVRLLSVCVNSNRQPRDVTLGTKTRHIVSVVAKNIKREMRA